ncbi:MAG: hypothetical protein WDW38_002881 [Sanguina aurantia]
MIAPAHEGGSEGPEMLDLSELDSGGSSACQFFTSREGLDIMQAHLHPQLAFRDRHSLRGSCQLLRLAVNACTRGVQLVGAESLALEGLLPRYPHLRELLVGVVSLQCLPAASQRLQQDAEALRGLTSLSFLSKLRRDASFAGVMAVAAAAAGGCRKLSLVKEAPAEVDELECLSNFSQLQHLHLSTHDTHRLQPSDILSPLSCLTNLVSLFLSGFDYSPILQGAQQMDEGAVYDGGGGDAGNAVAGAQAHHGIFDPLPAHVAAAPAAAAAAAAGG